MYFIVPEPIEGNNLLLGLAAVRRGHRKVEQDLEKLTMGSKFI